MFVHQLAEVLNEASVRFLQEALETTGFNIRLFTIPDFNRVNNLT